MPAEQSLRAEKLIKIYRQRRVVNEVSLELTPGEIVGLLGPNGAGKSTTFYMLTGLISSNNGRMFLDGRNVTRLAMYRRARRGVGYLPQEPSIFRKLTVRDNLLLILEARSDLYHLSRRDRNARIDSLLDKLNIKHLARQRGSVLSGGERRRAEIARALATEPRYLLMDEPFTGIDPKSVEELQDLLRGLVENPGENGKRLGILITDHNVRETLQITDRSYIMYEGKILISGTSESIAQDPEARRYYLGERFKFERHDASGITNGNGIQNPKSEPSSSELEARTNTDIQEQDGKFENPQSSEPREIRNPKSEAPGDQQDAPPQA